MGDQPTTQPHPLTQVQTQDLEQEVHDAATAFGQGSQGHFLALARTRGVYFTRLIEAYTKTKPSPRQVAELALLISPVLEAFDTLLDVVQQHSAVAPAQPNIVIAKEVPRGR